MPSRDLSECFGLTAQPPGASNETVTREDAPGGSSIGAAAGWERWRRQVGGARSKRERRRGGGGAEFQDGPAAAEGVLPEVLLAGDHAACRFAPEEKAPSPRRDSNQPAKMHFTGRSHFF